MRKFFLFIFIFLNFHSFSFAENFKFKKITSLNEPWGSSFISNNEIKTSLSQEDIDMLEVPEVMEKVRFDIARGLIINPKDVWIKEVLNHYDIALQDNLAES